VPFKVPAHNSGDGGRRVAVHEFPGRDKPYVEDLGRRISEFDIEAYIVGDDYIAARDELIDACSRSGAGELVHPFSGTRTVFCTECRYSERIDEGRMVRFSLKFIEEGENTYPATAEDTAAVAAAAADNLVAVSETSFASSFDVTGLPAFVAEAAETTVNSLIATLPGVNGALSAAASLMTADLPSLVLTPADLASRITSLVSTAYGTSTALDTLTSAASFGASLPAVPTTTATRLLQAANQESLSRLVSRTIVAAATRTAVAAVYPDRGALEAAREAIKSLLETEIVTASDNGDREIFQSLRAVRTAALSDLSARAPRLARIVSIQPAAAQSTLLAAYRLYGTATRADEIKALNGVRHPGFLPGGSSFEALSDV
jgi:prophage DNA circulation protein